MSDTPFVDYSAAASVTAAVNSRRSLRAFKPDAVARETLEDIVRSAARAPSGTNMQPWFTYVLTGDTLAAVCEATCAAYDTAPQDHKGEVRYYPEKWFDPYLARRRQVGWALYGLLGIEKGDRERMRLQHRRNFTFFDAPVGMLFTIHRDLATGSWLDYGMYLQNVMLLAREAGLHTCPQAAWADYHQVLRDVLPISSDEVIVCGMAVGYADAAAIENTLVTERVDNVDNTRFLD